MKNKENILITGATGFIGSHISKELVKRGYLVFGLSLVDENHKEIYLLKGDIRDLNTLYNVIKENKIKTVLHLAALIPHKESLHNPFLCFDVNARGTLNLLNAAYLNGVDKFIYTSTMSVYSEPPRYLPVDENHPTQPSTIYGASKLEGELYCNIYSSAMNMVVLRYGGVYGKGQQESNATIVAMRFIKQALNNEPITIYGDGNQSSDFLYIEDMLQGTFLALEKNITGVYNIGGGEEISIIDLAKRIINLTNSRSKIVFINKNTNRPFRFVLDIKKAQKILGYSPSSLNNNLSKYILEL